MDKRGKRQAASLFGGMGFYIALLVCVIAAGVTGYVALSGEDGSGTEVPEVHETGDQQEEIPPVPVSEPDEKDEAQSVLGDEPLVVTYPLEKPEPKEDTAPVSETEDTPEPVPVSGESTGDDAVGAARTIVSPLAGETVAVFSVDRLMYDATLGDWRTHDGIDIRAEAGTEVVATAAGTVLSVEEDGRLGVTVCIEHAGGYVTTYASLHPEVAVEAGASVAAGEVIGAVGNTSLSEASLGAHLHFAVSRNGESMDPAAYLPKES